MICFHGEIRKCLSLYPAYLADFLVSPWLVSFLVSPWLVSFLVSPWLVSFFLTECSSSTSTTPVNDTTSETFTITTNTALLTLTAGLDYESTKSYYFLMTVVDQGLSPRLTGSVALRVSIILCTVKLQ